MLIELIVHVADGARPAFPKHTEDCELGVGRAGGLPVNHGSPVSYASTYTKFVVVSTKSFVVTPATSRLVRELPARAGKLPAHQPAGSRRYASNASFSRH